MAPSITIEAYHPHWPALYERESRAIAHALGDLLARIEHIGSTAVPGLGAQPIVDVMPGVAREAELDRTEVAPNRRRIHRGQVCLDECGSLGHEALQFGNGGVGRASEQAIEAVDEVLRGKAHLRDEAMFEFVERQMDFGV